MSLSETLFSELHSKLGEKNLDFAAASEMLLSILPKEEPLIFVFGKGFAPDNPTTIIDLIIVTQKFVFGFDFVSDRSTYSFLKISEVKMVIIDIFQDHIRLNIRGGLDTYFYINTDLTNLENVQKVAAKIRELIEGSIGRL